MCKILVCIVSGIVSISSHASTTVEKYLEICSEKKGEAISKECAAFTSGMDQGLIYGALFGSTKVARMADQPQFREQMKDPELSMEAMVRYLHSRNLSVTLDYCQEFSVPISTYANLLRDYIKEKRIDPGEHIFMVYKDMLAAKYPIQDCPDRKLDE